MIIYLLGEYTENELTEKATDALKARIKTLEEDTGKEIEDLDQKLDTVLEKNEKDFLTAYRFHMLKVQNELM